MFLGCQKVLPARQYLREDRGAEIVGPTELPTLDRDYAETFHGDQPGLRQVSGCTSKMLPDTGHGRARKSAHDKTL